VLRACVPPAYDVLPACVLWSRGVPPACVLPACVLPLYGRLTFSVLLPCASF
jgi:hypothetical protein